jgi:methylmalonyl-CoA mutase
MRLQEIDTDRSASSVSGSAERLRILTAASLFDGHDAAIHLIRRLLQDQGVEIIHIGHNRGAEEIVNAAIQEGVHAIAVTSYQGGHNEFFRYMYDLLQKKGAGHIRIFGGGGGTILPSEIAELQNYGIERIYHPDDGRALGLVGMARDVVERCPKNRPEMLPGDIEAAKRKDAAALSRILVTIEKHSSILRTMALQEDKNHQPVIPVSDEYRALIDFLKNNHPSNPLRAPVIGITGPGGSGKSSLTDELVRRFLNDFEDIHIAILSIDPTRKKTGGALLGDRIRMNSASDRRVFMRSLATGGEHDGLSSLASDFLQCFRAAGFDLILLETAGIGQADSAVSEIADITLYVMTPEYGASTQLEKIGMLDYADLIALNKSDRRNAEDALQAVRKQYQRNRHLFHEPLERMPVFSTTASRFSDPGTDRLYEALVGLTGSLAEKRTRNDRLTIVHPGPLIPQRRIHYLQEIVDDARHYRQKTEEWSLLARQLQSIERTIALLKEELPEGDEHSSTIRKTLEKKAEEIRRRIPEDILEAIKSFPEKVAACRRAESVYKVRDREIRVKNFHTSLSGLSIPKVAVPRFSDAGDIVRWIRHENFPGAFPFTAGIYPFKRSEEDPIRMFAGEGGPERTNRRFHYLSQGMPAVRLSTAFDSVTLYGEDPDLRPDIYGKVGNAGVSICSLDDAKRLYSGFRLCDPRTSVSMTINGPAPMILAFYFNAAIDQECEIYLRENGLLDEANRKIDDIYRAMDQKRPVYHGELPEGHDGLGLALLGITGDRLLEREVYEKIKARTLSQLRGTVQADILKEDQAQNTCIFSIEFALRMMGDIQEFFSKNRIRNFYSVSVSGYHIAEAGANPITQLAFTLANGFTYLEYYLSRGLHIDEVAPNLSFFFSNGMDPEYSVIGRVARRIWAMAIKHRYGGNERSQMLKYHIQTSGRSLHAQEISFNDIRTTLQALYAIYDNCNSLHTNAYDEAITTPTEESVRRAVAIQLVINRELGLAKNENPLQGSFVIEELTDLVEEAVFAEFQRLSDRGGVLGAMETMYQRNRIQEESMHYETLKNSGELPVIGVNTFLDPAGSPTVLPPEIVRSTDEEKRRQIERRDSCRARFIPETAAALDHLQRTAIAGENVFTALLEASKTATLGQMTHTLYRAGGEYRRSM